MIARVTLEIALRREFDYRIPEELADRIEVGSRVKIPFGRRTVMGYVTAMVEHSPHGKLRAILDTVGSQSLVTPKVLKLARWIGEYYCCAPEIALKSVLPQAVRKEQEGWKESLFVGVSPTPPVEAPKLTKRQREVFALIEERGPLLLRDLLKLAGTTADTVRKLENKGLATIQSKIQERDPYAEEQILPSQELELNDEQAPALQQIIAALDAIDGKGAPPSSASDPALRAAKFLLHGVTGSGKTEVYLQAIAHTLEQGKGAIVLVPEISLTPQTVERFKARFCAGSVKTLVAVLHSHLSTGERHDEWHKIRQGRARIVIGARSAIFAPVDPLGLIIVDEEHEHSYKQAESPRYHARDVAVVRGQMENAVVVLGSATPSMESYYNAKNGKYRLLDMPTRVDDKKMPLVRVIDMRYESRKQKGPPIFSNPLVEGIRQRVERREQSILFLNRRGYATSMQCQVCGYVAECPDCSVSLTYHRDEQTLRCHTCGHAIRAPKVCPAPECGSSSIRFSGLGTQKVEETLKKLFPKAEIQRMDSDVLRKKNDFRKILGEFRTGKIDILIGTQMIAKGLHFPNVTLVGIIHADLSLHIPDFRAGERTFQLLTQVAGRAGRGDVEGEVFVQSFTPFHAAIQYARSHDYEGFYDAEMEFREQLKYPPLSRVAMLTLRGRNEDKVEFSAQQVKTQAEKALADIDDIVIMGPAPAPLARAEKQFRFQIMIRARNMSRVSAILSKLTQALKLPDEVLLAVDIDPVNLF
ncbi:MAG: primosomal protein N' (replication factor Y) [Limisphaerales bacterium]|jgi:primosomal protein N' (replication factor Y)